MAAKSGSVYQARSAISKMAEEREQVCVSKNIRNYCQQHLGHYGYVSGSGLKKEQAKRQILCVHKRALTRLLKRFGFPKDMDWICN
jgi:hypothetical protein